METVVKHNWRETEKLAKKIKIMTWITAITLFLLVINVIGTMLLIGGMLVIDEKIG